jgi:hypothetical protein
MLTLAGDFERHDTIGKIINVADRQPRAFFRDIHELASLNQLLAQCPLLHALRTQLGPRLRSEKGQNSDMHHRIGAKLRPRQVVSATCGLSFPR